MKIKMPNKKINVLLLPIRFLYRLFRTIKLQIQHKISLFFAILRKKGWHDRKFEKLKEFKDIHYGKRCFIVCTGPSLNYCDLDRIENEYSISMNNIFKAFQNTIWRPTYYGIQDESVYKKLKNEPEFQAIKDKMIGDYTYRRVKTRSECILFPLDILGGRSFRRIIGLLPKIEKIKIPFSDDIYSIVYNGGTITYSLLQIAVYMGFKEIYLIGCDCDYSGPKKHFSEYNEIVVKNEEREKKASEYSAAVMIKAYQSAKKYADEHGIKIYNATRGGKLEVFERVNFDSLFPKERNIKS